MSIFDKKTYNIDTNDSIDIVIENLSSKIEKEKFLQFEDQIDRPFVGKFRGNDFKIKRKINYKNSFNPTIEGKISARSYGTNVKVKICVSPIAQVFMVIWLLLLIAFFGMLLMSSILSRIVLIILPILIIIGLIGLSSNNSYKKESLKSERILNGIVRNGKGFNPNLKLSNE